LEVWPAILYFSEPQEQGKQQVSDDQLEEIMGAPEPAQGLDVLDEDSEDDEHSAEEG
jgi:hypothetical protein